VYAVIDIDGTVADETARRLAATDEQGKMDWDAYFRAADVDRDPPIPDAATVLSSVHAAGVAIAYVSSRPESLRETTAAWLDRYQFPTGDLILRGKYQRTHEFKSAALQRLAQSGTIAFAAGDREQDLEVYRAAGVPAVHVTGVEAGVWRALAPQIGGALAAAGIAWSAPAVVAPAEGPNTPRK
ncbi:MAG: hypothetical protein HYV63_04860, partial [Candidatus Schekmanbacteria bacterium]|nr:hypothetical protein [Candidatus Schekmanbacteria bacterium]